MFTAIITTGEGTVKVRVDYEKETVHSDSPHRLDQSILDDRVPLGWIVLCNVKGAVIVKFERPRPPVAGKRITTRVAPDFLSSENRWIISPCVKGESVTWCEGWTHIPCQSEAHCQHIIDVLKQGKIPQSITPHIV